MRHFSIYNSSIYWKVGVVCIMLWLKFTICPRADKHTFDMRTVNGDYECLYAYLILLLDLQPVTCLSDCCLSIFPNMILAFKLLTVIRCMCQPSHVIYCCIYIVSHFGTYRLSFVYIFYSRFYDYITWLRLEFSNTKVVEFWSLSSSYCFHQKKSRTKVDFPPMLWKRNGIGGGIRSPRIFIQPYEQRNKWFRCYVDIHRSFGPGAL